jgi:hypothetical protein
VAASLFVSLPLYSSFDRIVWLQSRTTEPRLVHFRKYMCGIME